MKIVYYFDQSTKFKNTNWIIKTNILFKVDFSSIIDCDTLSPAHFIIIKDILKI